MPKLTFLDNGHEYEVKAGTSFLEFCQANGEHDFGCTVGSCGTCRLVIESGAGNVNPAGSEELETVEMCTDVAGARLGCQLRVKGDIKVRQLD
jgi:ferredoxin